MAYFIGIVISLTGMENVNGDKEIDSLIHK